MGRRPEGTTARRERVTVRFADSGYELLKRYAKAEHDGQLSRALRALAVAGLKAWEATQRA